MKLGLFIRMYTAIAAAAVLTVVANGTRGGETSDGKTLC